MMSEAAIVAPAAGAMMLVMSAMAQEPGSFRRLGIPDLPLPDRLRAVAEGSELSDVWALRLELEDSARAGVGLPSHVRGSCVKVLTDLLGSAEPWEQWVGLVVASRMPEVVPDFSRSIISRIASLFSERELDAIEWWDAVHIVVVWALTHDDEEVEVVARRLEEGAERLVDPLERKRLRSVAGDVRAWGGRRMEWQEGGDVRVLRRMSIQSAFKRPGYQIRHVWPSDEAILRAGLQVGQWHALNRPLADVAEVVGGEVESVLRDSILVDRAAMLGVLCSGGLTNLDCKGVIVVLRASVACGDISEIGPLEGKLLVVRSLMEHCAAWTRKDRMRIREELVRLRTGFFGDEAYGIGDEYYLSVLWGRLIEQLANSD